MTPSVLSGLFVALFLIIMLIIGISCLYDIKTNDKFDYDLFPSLCHISSAVWGQKIEKIFKRFSKVSFGISSDKIYFSQQILHASKLQYIQQILGDFALKSSQQMIHDIVFIILKDKMFWLYYIYIIYIDYILLFRYRYYQNYNPKKHIQIKKEKHFTTNLS